MPTLVLFPENDGLSFDAPAPAASPDLTAATLATTFLFVLPLSIFVSLVACCARLGVL